MPCSQIFSFKAWVSVEEVYRCLTFEWVAAVLPAQLLLHPQLLTTHLRCWKLRVRKAVSWQDSWEAVLSCGVIPVDRDESFIDILNLYQGKGEAEALDHGGYRSFKLIDQIMKLLERVLDFYICKMVNIDKMQFSSVPGRATTDTIFVVRQLYFAFIDLEKAFNCVPRKVLWWVLRSLGVEEWAVQVNDQYSEEFGVRVGVHQSSVLNPLFCILAFETLSHVFRAGVPWQLLYAEDPVLITDTQEEYISKVKAWKAGMESKGLHVNTKKTKFLVSDVGHDVLKKSGKYPCTVYSSGIGSNSLQCSQCKLWATRGAVALLDDWWSTKTVCHRCIGKAWSIDSRTETEEDVDGPMLDVEATYCYLGDMLCSGGGCESAIGTRCCTAWIKFRKWLSVLITRHFSPKIPGKVCTQGLCSLCNASLSLRW